MKHEKTSAKREATFEAVLLDLIRLAQLAMSESKAQKSSGGSLRAEVGAAEASPQTLLRRSLEGLGTGIALKVRTLMVAGRDGRDVAGVRLATTLGESEAAFTMAAADASENGALLADYLRRGHALACAAGIDLEAPVAAWASDQTATLDERAWLSFGRQLASSEPEDWQFVGCVEAGGHDIIRLYVRLRDHAWWSFQSLLDRPSTAFVGKETRALSSRRSKGIAASSLRTLAARLCKAPVAAGKGSAATSSRRSPTQGKALRRAARAILARVGEESA